MKKIGFVGAGAIGSTSAYATLAMTDVEEIVVYDIFREPAEGHAMDLSSSAIAFGRRTRVRGTDDFAELAGSDLLVVSAGFPRKPGMTRVDLLEKNLTVIRDIAANAKRHAPEAVFLLVTNPVDVLLMAAQDVLKYPRERVLGMGSLHDSVRVTDLLVDAGILDAQGVILGEHGETMFPVPSLSSGTGIEKVDWDAIEKQTRERAMEIIKRKGATSWAPGATTARMVRAIVDDTHETIPSCVLLDGEYGFRDVAIGLPAILGRKGVVEVVEAPLRDDERRKLEQSVQAVRQKVEEARGMKTSPAT